MLWGRVSPNGTHVVGVRSPIYGGRSDLVAVTLDGRESWKLDLQSSGAPSVSPDGTRVAFEGPAGRLDVYDIAADRLTFVGDGHHPSWAPGSNRIAYDDGAKVRIYEFVGEGYGPTVEAGTEPSWSPNGEELAMRAGPHKIELVNLKSGERRDLLEANHVSTPRWSPDGRLMMYTFQGRTSRWSLFRLFSEPHQIMIRDSKTGAEMRVGIFDEPDPGDYTWVTSRTLCRHEAAGQ
jgi:Tol biopolymer transport system component